MPMLIAGTVLAAGVYALGRVATRVRQARVVAPLDAQSESQANRSERAQPPPDPLTLDLSDLFDGRELVAEENRDPASVTVQTMARIPRPSSADDAEAVTPEDFEQHWLSHATQSERSWSETAPLDIEDIAAPSQEPDEADIASVDYRKPLTGSGRVDSKAEAWTLHAKPNREH